MSIVLKILLSIVSAVGIPLILVSLLSAIISQVCPDRLKPALQLLAFLVVAIGGVVLWAFLFKWFAVLYGIISIPVALMVFGLSE